MEFVVLACSSQFKVFVCRLEKVLTCPGNDRTGFLKLGQTFQIERRVVCFTSSCQTCRLNFGLTLFAGVIQSFHLSSSWSTFSFLLYDQQKHCSRCRPSVLFASSVPCLLGSLRVQHCVVDRRSVSLRRLPPAWRYRRRERFPRLLVASQRVLVRLCDALRQGNPLIHSFTHSL